MQVVCFEGREAHVVAAGASIAGRTGRARDTYFVGGLSYPVPPGRQKTHNPQVRRMKRRIN